VPPPPPPTDAAVAYQVNPSHTGAQASDPLAPALVRTWTRDLGGDVSYPVVAGGKVFVTVANVGAYGTRLYALDLATGAVVWGPFDLGGTYWWSAAAYDGGRVFVQNYDGVLRALDASTGVLQWSVRLPGQSSFTSPPAAWQGVVYTAGAGLGGTVYAVDGGTGAVLWTAPVANGDHSSAVVTDTDVFVSYACARTYDLDRLTGAQRWVHDTGCSGGGGATPTFGAGALWVRDALGGVALDPATGAVMSTFSAGPAPAFDGVNGIFLNGATLEAHNPTAGVPLWTFAGDGQLTSAPVVANGVVYVGSASGNVYALDERTGAVRTVVNVGSPVPAPDERNVSQPLTGMAIGLGRLVVPGTHTVTVYGSA
jgi:outer membrane protein assembly factor BamB